MKVTIQATKEERAFYRLKPHRLPSEWAPRHRVITYGPRRGARFDPHFMPHVLEMMDAAATPCVREVVNCKAPQTGGSAAWETFLGNRADVAPGDALIVYPNQETCRKRCTDYLQPMFQQSPRLRGLLTGVADDMASMRIKLHPMLIYMGWAGSVTSIGNVSVRYLLVDELDKCPKQPSKDEAGFEALVSERTTAFDRFGGSVKIWNSTPTIAPSPIARRLRLVDVVFDYEARCPHCGHRQVMDFDHIFFGEERDPERMERLSLARYRCEGCAVLWEDRERDLAVRAGRWIARGDGRSLKAVLREDRPARVGFHSPAWISPLNSLSKCAAAFLRGLQDKTAMIYFDTQIKAEEHLPDVRRGQEDELLELKEDRPAGLVPGGGVVQCLVAGSDTQDNGSYFWIDAVGWGLEGERWRIRAGFVETMEALIQVVFGTEYRDAEGNAYPVRLMMVDAMGHRTGDVYDLCRRFPMQIIPYKGASGRRATPYTKTPVDVYPGTKTPIPGGIFLYTCDSHHYKDLAAIKLSIKAGDPGAWHFDAGLTREEVAHLCAEYRDAKGLWQCPHGRANHYWDSAVLALIAGEIITLRFNQRPDTPRRPAAIHRPPQRANTVEAGQAAPVSPQRPQSPPPRVNPYTGGRQLFGRGW